MGYYYYYFFLFFFLIYNYHVIDVFPLTGGLNKIQIHILMNSVKFEQIEQTLLQVEHQALPSTSVKSW